MGNGSVACSKKVVYQIEIICGNFFACLFDLLLEAAETLVDVLDGGCVQVLLRLDGMGLLCYVLFVYLFC